MVFGPRQIFCSDLISFEKFGRSNGGNKWLGIVLDTFTKFMWGFEIKTKQPKNVKAALEKVFRKKANIRLETDKGLEYTARLMRTFYTDRGIIHYTRASTQKNNICERAIRTIKAKVYRWFSHSKKFNWTSVIQQIIKTYNSEYHSSIQMTPIAASKEENASKVFQNLYRKLPEPTKPLLNVHDEVKISHTKLVFAKSYKERWSRENYFIYSVNKTSPTTYKLVDGNNNILDGIFYEQELQLVGQHGK